MPRLLCGLCSSACKPATRRHISQPLWCWMGVGGRGGCVRGFRLGARPGIEFQRGGRALPGQGRIERRSGDPHPESRGSARHPPRRVNWRIGPSWRWSSLASCGRNLKCRVGIRSLCTWPFGWRSRLAVQDASAARRHVHWHQDRMTRQASIKVRWRGSAWLPARHPPRGAAGSSKEAPSCPSRRAYPSAQPSSALPPGQGPSPRHPGRRRDPRRPTRARATRRRASAIWRDDAATVRTLVARNPAGW